MQIYVHRNNQQVGPFTEAEVKFQLAAGTLSLQDHAWWQGQATWLPLAQTPFGGNAALPAVPVPGAPAVPPQAGPHSSYPKTSNLALWSMICGIGAIICSISFIPAIVLGHMGLSETKKDPTLRGRGMAITGLVLGYFWALLIVVIVVISVLIALGQQVKGVETQVKATQVQNSSDSSDSTSSDSNTNATPAVTP